METVVSRIFIHNWQRKLVAFVSAIIIWFFVNQSITATKTITNVPIRVINLPADKTIKGMFPNGILNKRMTLILSGTKNVIDELEPGDLEVILDASVATHNEWIVQVTKKNLVSLNPSIDLVHHITQVENNEFILKLSRLVTEKIPVRIEPPIGDPPDGYSFLDVWPQNLVHTLSGPEEEIQKLKEKGFELIFNLKEITKADLDAFKNTVQNNSNNEISYPVPKKWKQIVIPFQNNTLEELNDPEAQNLHLDFLRKAFQPLEKEIPIHIFFPLNHLDQLNPENLSLATNEYVQNKNGVYVFTFPLYTYDVSTLFIKVVQEYLELTIVASPKSERDLLSWSLNLIDIKELEDTYVAFSLANSANNKKEKLLRERFHQYMQHLNLYNSENEKMHLNSRLEKNQIVISPF